MGRTRPAPPYERVHTGPASVASSERERQVSTTGFDPSRALQDESDHLVRTSTLSTTVPTVKGTQAGAGAFGGCAGGGEGFV